MIPLSDENPIRSTPFITYLLIAINVAVFVYQLTLGPQVETFIRACGFVPAEITGGAAVDVPACVQPPQITVLTSMFIHGGFLHIGSNMLYLWIFGNNVEDSMGHLRYLFFYFIAGIAAALLQTVITMTFTPQLAGVPNVGASGAIAGVLGGYLVMYPGARIKTLVALGIFWAITRVPALLLLGFWFLLQFFQGIGALGQREVTGGVAFWAHIGGFVAGMLLIKLLAREPRGRRAVPAVRF